RQKNTQVLLGEAVDLDPARKLVLLRDAAEFPYDTLIIATGSQTSYYGKDAWREAAPSLKTLEEATAIRHKLLYAFERAERSADPAEARAWLTFIIVGAGATGLELAGALAEIARETLRHDFRNTHPEDLSAKAEALVTRLGVEVMKGVFVTDITPAGVTYKHGDHHHSLAARTVLWAGGVTSTPFGKKVAERFHAETDRAGRIKVQPDLTVPGHPEIFIVGDLALAQNENGQPLPGVAQVAIQGGRFAAKVIAARLAGKTPPPRFHYLNKGDMAVIGRAAAVANILGIHISGFPAWLVWLF